MNKEEHSYYNYILSLQEAWRLLFKHIIIYVPDLLFVSSSIFFILMFLSINGLLTPILHVDRLYALQTAFRNILQSTPALIKLLISTAFFLIINLSIGIAFISTRFLLIKNYLHHKPLHLFHVFKQSKNYFWQVFFTKFLFLLFYLTALLFFFFILSLTRFRSAFPILFTLLVIALFLVKFFFFFTYPILFLQDKGVKAFLYAARYSKNYAKHTLITLGILAVLSFFIAIFLSLFLQAWVSIALSANLFSYTSSFLVVYFIFSRIVGIVYTVFESGFIFSSYKKHQH